MVESKYETPEIPGKGEMELPFDDFLAQKFKGDVLEFNDPLDRIEFLSFD